MTTTSHLQGALVGRQRDLAVLRAALDAARDAKGQLFLLSGEPGIGKTRLAEETESLARAASFRVLWGRCHEAEGRPPFWPWVQVLRAHALDSGPAAFAAEIDADLLPLALLAPELRPYLPAAPAPTSTSGLHSESARFRLFQQFAALLNRSANARPLLLILDDLHWADMPSLHLLEFLAQELDRAPLVLLGTYRDVDIRRSPLAAEMIERLVARIQPMALSGLTVDEVADFVAASSEHTLSAATVARLHRDTEGNPLFLGEMVRLFQTGEAQSPSPAGPWPLPQGVLGAIRQRLAPLPAATRHLLAVAAIVGREFDLWILEAVLQTPRAGLQTDLTAAIDLGIAHEIGGYPDRFRFSHALIRDAVHAELRAAERAELHLRVGQILEARYANSRNEILSELAYHFYEAAMLGEEAKALEYAARAGEASVQALAYEEAVDQFERALHLFELTPGGEPRDHCELLLRLADARSSAAQDDAAIQAYQLAATLARKIGAAVLLARAAIGWRSVGTFWTQYGRSDEVIVGMLREALAGLDAGEIDLRARTMAQLATELYWATPVVDTDSISAEAVALARQTGNTATLAAALRARIRCLSDPDRGAERLAAVDEVIALTEGRGELAVLAYLWRLGEALQDGEMDDVAKYRESLIDTIRESRQPRNQYLLPGLNSQNAFLEGRLDEAESAALAMLNQAASKGDSQVFALGLLFLVRREQDRHGEFAAPMSALAYQSPSVTVWRTGLAMLSAETGGEAAARSELDALVCEDLTSLRRDTAWVIGAASLAEACARCGRPEQAAMIYRALLPHAARHAEVAPSYYFGPVSYYLGILARREGRYEVARRHLDDALTVTRRIGAFPFIARTLIAQAQTLELEGHVDSPAALSLRREAAAIAAARGLTLIAREAVRHPAPAAAAVSELPPTASFQPSGDLWVLSFRGRTTTLNSRRGFEYLAQLFAAPGTERHVLDLVRPSGDREVAAHVFDDDLGAVLDPRAKREIRQRLQQLHAEVATAEANNDDSRATQALAEIEAIGVQLSQAVGLGGRNRRRGGAAERARGAVGKAIRQAIREIAAAEPELGEILTSSIHTGVFCSYTPTSSVTIVWRSSIE